MRANCKRSAKYPNFTNYRPKMRTENLALDSLSTTRRLCRGFKMRSHVGELVTQILTPRPQGPSVDFVHRLIVPAILTICLAKKVKIQRRKITASCAPSTAPPPPWILLMSFIGPTKKHLQPGHMSYINRKNV